MRIGFKHKCPVLVMILIQIAYAVMNVLYKLAVEDGMNPRILIAYRSLFAAAFMLPLSLILERKSLAKVTWVVLFQAFLCGLLGVTLSQNLYIEGLALTTTTFAVAMTNLLPTFTFIIAVCFGVEKLRMGTKAGKAKVLGTLVGIGGAMLATFYKGIEFSIWNTHINLLHENPHSHVSSLHDSLSRRIIGSILTLGSSASFALWLIVQTKMSASYPYYYSSTALLSTMGCIQSLVLALCTARDWNQWKLGFNIRLLSAAYSGIVPSGVVIAVISWCVRVKGPVFVSSFNPLAIVIIAIAGTLVLDENLHLGSVLGAVFIVCGLYMVLWGKSKEMKKMSEAETSSEPCPANLPITHD